MKKKLLATLVISVPLLFGTCYAAGHAGNESEVQVQMAEGDMASRSSSYDTFIASSSEPRVRMVFSVKKPVRDFKVLALSATDVDANGKVTYAVDERYVQDKLTPERPLIVETAFFGSMPNNGISYVDGNGTLKRFTVEISGKDGSLFLWEF
ncbi:MAG: hypothetical protein ACI4NO_02760 [Oxalobacter sp.]